MVVSKAKQDEVMARMQRLHIQEKDLIETFILGSGPGGQKVNKTSSTVYLKHLPSGTEIKSSRGRSQELNRYLARRTLCEKLERERLGIKTPKEKEIEKIKKQKKRKARKLKIKLLKNSKDNL